MHVQLTLNSWSRSEAKEGQTRMYRNRQHESRMQVKSVVSAMNGWRLIVCVKQIRDAEGMKERVLNYKKKQDSTGDA